MRSLSGPLTFFFSFLLPSPYTHTFVLILLFPYTRLTRLSPMPIVFNSFLHLLSTHVLSLLFLYPYLPYLYFFFYLLYDEKNRLNDDSLFFLVTFFLSMRVRVVYLHLLQTNDNSTTLQRTNLMHNGPPNINKQYSRIAYLKKLRHQYVH